MGEFNTKSGAAKIVLLNNKTKSYVKNMKNQYFDFNSDNNKIDGNNGIYVIYAARLITKNQGKKGKTTTTNKSIHSTSTKSLYRSVGVTVTSGKVGSYDLKSYFKKKKLGSINKVGRWYEYDNGNGWRAQTKYKAENPTILTVEQTKDVVNGRGYWTYKAYVIPWKHFKTMCDTNKIDLYSKAAKKSPIYVHSIMQKLSGGHLVRCSDNSMRFSVSKMGLSGYSSALKTYYNHKLYLPDLSAKVYVDSFYDDGKKVTKITSSNYTFSVNAKFGTQFRMRTVKKYEESKIGGSTEESDRWLNLMKSYDGAYIYDVQETTTRSKDQYRSDGKRVVSHAGNGYKDGNFVKAYNNISSKTKPWDAYDAYLTRFKSKYHKVNNLNKYYQVIYKTGDVQVRIKVKAYLIDGNKNVTVGKTTTFSKATELKELNATYTMSYGKKYTISYEQSSNSGSTIIKIPMEYTGSKGNGCRLVKVDNSWKSGSITLYDKDKSTCYSSDKTLEGYEKALNGGDTYDSDLSKFYKLTGKATRDLTIHVFYLKYQPPKSQITIKHVNINNGETYIQNKSLGENPFSKSDNKNETTIQFHNNSKSKTYRKGNKYYVYIPDKIKDNKVGADVYPVKITFDGNNSKGKSMATSYSINSDGSFVGDSLDNGRFKPTYIAGKELNNYPQKYADFKKALRAKKYTHYEAVGSGSTRGTTITIYYSTTSPNVSVHYRRNTWIGQSITNLNDYQIPKTISVKTEAVTKYKKNAKTALAVKQDPNGNKYYVTSLWVAKGGGSPTVHTEYNGSGELGSAEYTKWWEDTFTDNVVSGSESDGELRLYFVYTNKPYTDEPPWVKYVDVNDLENPMYETDTDEDSKTGKDYTFPSDFIKSPYDDKVLVNWKITINGESSKYTDTMYNKKDGVTLAQAANPYADPETLVQEILATTIKMQASNATLWLVYDEDIEPPEINEIPEETEVFEKTFEQVSESEVSALIHDEVPLNEEYEYDLQSDEGGIPTSDYLYTEAMAKKYQTAFQYQSTTGGYEYCIRFYYTGDDGLESIDVPVTRMYEYKAVNSLDIMKADSTLIKNVSLGQNNNRGEQESEQDTLYYDLPDITVSYQNAHGITTPPTVMADTDILSAVTGKIGLTATRIVKDETGYGIAVRIQGTLTDEQITALEELADTVYGNYVSTSDILTAEVYKEGSETPTTVTFLDASNMNDFYAIQTEEDVERGEATDDVDDDADVDVPESDDTNVIEDTNNNLAEENILYKKVSDETLNHGIQIPSELSNGEKLTTATTKYVRAISLTKGSSSIKNSGSAEYSVPTNCNNVWIHTPVVSTATTYINTEGDDADSTSILQTIELEETETNVSLGKTFTVSWSVSGNHKEALGYQTRDYSKYVDKISIVCPFEVKYNNGYYDKGEEIVVYDRDEAGEKYDVTKHPTKAKLEVPLWAPTGSYSVQVRVYALNAVTDTQKSSMEDSANTLMKNYVAVGSDTVVVHGNVYGFQVYDISDYPTWQSVFRKENSLDLTGRTYTVGTRTIEGEENGHSSRATLPIIKGSHPTIDSAGPLSRGYAFRYRLSTTGSMSDLDDKINIQPTFYYVSKDGSDMQEVDLYYSQTIGSRKSYLVKVGSVLDTGNKHYIQTGDKYLGIPESELSITSTLSGVSLASLKAQKKSVYSYGSIQLPSALRTFAGKDKSKYTLSGNTGKGSNKPYASEATIKKCMQRWYGEYYLPSDVHAVPKGFDVASYGSTGSVDFEESFWLKDGYIVVNFEIVTSNGGQEELSYNPGIKGTVNMWKREGYQINRSDSTGAAFVFHEGDVVLYDTNNAAANDYDSSGTH